MTKYYEYIHKLTSYVDNTDEFDYIEYYNDISYYLEHYDTIYKIDISEYVTYATEYKPNGRCPEDGFNTVIIKIPDKIFNYMIKENIEIKFLHTCENNIHVVIPERTMDKLPSATFMPGNDEMFVLFFDNKKDLAKIKLIL